MTVVSPLIHNFFSACLSFDRRTEWSLRRIPKTPNRCVVRLSLSHSIITLSFKRALQNERQSKASSSSGPPLFSLASSMLFNWEEFPETHEPFVLAHARARRRQSLWLTSEASHNTHLLVYLNNSSSSSSIDRCAKVSTAIIIMIKRFHRFWWDNHRYVFSRRFHLLLQHSDVWLMSSTFT